MTYPVTQIDFIFWMQMAFMLGICVGLLIALVVMGAVMFSIMRRFKIETP